MPFKDPEKKREYHRKYIARKKLREAFEKGLLYGENGRPLTEARLEELEHDLDLVWYGEKPFEFEYATCSSCPFKNSSTIR
jgi:hypothetical protein